MVWAYVGIVILWIAIWHYFVWREIRFSPLQALKDILPFALTAAGVMVVTWFVTEFIVYSLEFIDDYLKLWVLLISRIIIATALYLLVMRMAGAVILKECMGFIKNYRI